MAGGGAQNPGPPSVTCCWRSGLTENAYQSLVFSGDWCLFLPFQIITNNSKIHKSLPLLGSLVLRTSQTPSSSLSARQNS